MRLRHLYLSHPQVTIDPDTDVTKWSLNDVGARRIAALAASRALEKCDVIVSSAETKAIETAAPLARHIGCPHEIRALMHENDRSATGFLAAQDFEATADQFFAHPNKSTRGWETANAAQNRIVSEVQACLTLYPDSRILFVGHGAVGTLLYCHLAGLTISRAHDQMHGGGCYFEFDDLNTPPAAAWQPLERLIGAHPDTQGA